MSRDAKVRKITKLLLQAPPELIEAVIEWIDDRLGPASADLVQEGLDAYRLQKG